MCGDRLFLRKEPPLSDEEARRLQKEVDDIGHVPQRTEMRQILERYFCGPISEDYLDLIERRFVEGHEDRAAYASYASHLSSWTNWLGTEWYEDADFTFDRKHGMTPRHLVVLIANKIADRDPSAPQPKLYHPHALVGTWQQELPAAESSAPILWRFEHDGSFRSSDPSQRELTHWCAQRGYPRYRLRLLRELQREAIGFDLYAVTISVGVLTGQDRDAYRFRRIA